MPDGPTPPLRVDPREVWPGGSAGPLLGWKLDLPAGAPPVIEVAHLGEPLGAVGENLLATTLTVKSRRASR